jgi:hypothetical protein
MNPHPADNGASRQRLTVSIITRDSESRLAGVIAEASCYADEVIVGVDAASTDRTFEVASEWADVVYRFRLPMEGQLAPARLLALEYATGDWILSLDDDESMEETFDTIVPELMAAGLAAGDAILPELRVRSEFTHYYFPRKCIVSLQPCEFLRSAPWFPDWQLRLFRNDPALVWKPPRPHSGYHVQGQGRYEPRSSILHFEPLLCGDAERRRKIDSYRRAGTHSAADELDRFSAEFPRHAARLRVAAERRPRAAPARIHPDVRELEVALLPPWQSVIHHVSMPAVVSAGSTVTGTVTVRNTGKLAWWPKCGGRSAAVSLGFHLLNWRGKMLQRNGGGFSLPGGVRPGEEVRVPVRFIAPAKRGDYYLEWDMLSQGECWFAQCGSAVRRTALRVCKPR